MWKVDRKNELVTSEGQMKDLPTYQVRYTHLVAKASWFGGAAILLYSSLNETLGACALGAILRSVIILTIVAGHDQALAEALCR